MPIADLPPTDLPPAVPPAADAPPLGAPALPSGVVVDLAELVALAERAARAAGDLVRDGRPERVEVAATKSSPVDVVTAMDLASEDLLRATLAASRPDDGVLGEEHGLTPGTSGITWVIDPIDGTVNYLYGLPGYAVLVAAVTGPAGVPPDPATWTVLAGCVHMPGNPPGSARGAGPGATTTWTATLGGGAWRDGHRLTLASPPPLDRCLVGTGFGYRRELRVLQGRVISSLLPQVRDLRRLGSAGIDLCLLASGALDLFFERGLSPWDLAAPSLVAMEAGAQVTGLHGAPAGGATTVAGHPDRVGELRALLEDLGADDPV